MKKVLYLIFVVLLIPLLLFANDVPPSWRTPTSGDLGQDAAWRNEDPDRYLLARGDFCGDGKEYVARLLVNDKDNKVGLFVTMASHVNATPLILITMEPKSLIECFGISVAKPGTYTTACGKGYFECKDGESEQIRLGHPGIDFFQYGSANSYFIWNAGKKEFDRIWISD